VPDDIQKNYLVIVQNCETQFDAPLYARITRDGRMALTVLYSEPVSVQGSASEDPEIGRAPAWDHLEPGAYRSAYALRGGLGAALWMARRIRRLRPDLVIVAGYYPRSHLLLSLLLKASGQPIGLRSDNTLLHTRFLGWKGYLRRRLIGWIQRLHDTWHPVGTQAEAYLRMLSGTTRPSFPFPYAVDGSWFAERAGAAGQQRAALLQEQGWPQQAFVLLGIMKWSEREDPLTLIEAVRQLLPRHPQLRLILVGDGPLRPQVEEAIVGLSDQVFCPGYAPYSALPRWYGLADAFVHPAVDEPWGVSVNEALASGLPVVASTGVGAAAELLRPAGSGLEFPAGDAVALAAAIERLLQEPSLRQRCTQAARAVAQGHDSARTIDQFEAALAWVRHG
jgi:glycosyltransferase involved in cell wall biosynthesis